MGKSALLSNDKGSNADKVQDRETSLLVSNKTNKTAKQNYLEDSEPTPKSYLGLLFELLATTACTSYSNSLSESVRFLESQVQAERHRSVVPRQEAEGLRKSLEHSDAYFWCNSKRWRILAPNMTKLIILLSLLPAWWIPRITFLELF